MAFLYENLDFMRGEGSGAKLPRYIEENLSPAFKLRPYQKAAFENFITHFESASRPHPSQTLFHMATGSGKTLIMAGLMLYLYKKGYRDFLFFVNLSNIVEKTKENFLNPRSSKYLFANEIVIDGERVRVMQVKNFQSTDADAINLCFSTTQGLHTDMWLTKENGISIDDFDARRVVLISDEAHHLNVDTRKKMNAAESENYHSWESTVRTIFERNSENVLLEFTATCDLQNPQICAAYQNKIVFDYPLKKFYTDKYSKDIITLRSNMTLMERVLSAAVLSQYRLKLFQAHRLSIKPLILFKAAKIADSKSFFAAFSDAIKEIDGKTLLSLSQKADSDVLRRAFDYFQKNNISLERLAAELRDEFSAEHCISVNDDKDATERQIRLNSLEDADNPYRAIFEVKKLDEGWDVLNLFDIVRLYETRQSGKNKISNTTISEAQLIGRGARYCPFQTEAEEPRFQRKYDDDTENEMRILEELYYHCQNDDNYVSELKRALREIGLGRENVVERKYVLKDEFKNDDLYKNGLIFLNRRKVKERKNVHGLLPTVRDKIYRYEVERRESGTDFLMEEELLTGGAKDDKKEAKRYTISRIAHINYAIVNKALMKYPVFKFNTLKSYFPNLKSTRDFITNENYLGGVKIDIVTDGAEPGVPLLFDAAFCVLGKIGEAISAIEESYEGTREFYAEKVREVFRDKTVRYTDPHDGGVGISQSDASVRAKWRVDLSQKGWFAYTDNFGTSEEKAFVAYFSEHIAPLRKKYEKIWLVRNERAFHVYSFDDGERFEPDYVLFLQKRATDGFEEWQIFIEPKGAHLIEQDSWKEKFLLRLKDEAIPVKKFVDDNRYSVWGFHFFNSERRAKEFEADFSTLAQ